MTVLLPITAATLTAGCTTFSDSDAVARVDDVELSEDELDELLLEIGASDEDLDGVLPAEPVRQVITAWIQETAIGLSDADIEGLYGQGLEASGVACPTVLSAETADAAEAALERLSAGEAYDIVFSETNVDPQLADAVGRIGCLPVDQFPPESREAADVVALFAINADDTFATAALPGAADTIGIVVGFRPFDDLNDQEANEVANIVRAAAAADIDVESIDVHVASRYGTFDTATGTVVALG